MHNLRRVLFNTQAGYAITLLRITTGLTFAAHGAQKLFGWFGGYGLEGTGQWMASIGLEPGVLMALLVFWPRIKRQQWRGVLARVLSVLLSAALIVLVALLFYKDYASLFRNNRELVKALSPSNSIAATPMSSAIRRASR